MIGKFITGKSFRGCLLYCLNDKPQKDQELSLKDRAEALLFNRCYGTDKELVQQFNEVRLLNQKLAEPVLHITLSFAPGEHLEKGQLSQIAEACALHFRFEANQYIAVAHHDTSHQHLHIVANRIGFDGRTLSDSKSYQKMAAFCRKIETVYNLKSVLSPLRFLPQKDCCLPRLDHRKEKLRHCIQEAITSSQSLIQFEEKIKASGYAILKGRGIAFLDGKGVKVKGSDLGYSLARIQQLFNERKLSQRQGDVQTIDLKVGVNAAGEIQEKAVQPAQSEKDHKAQAQGLSKAMALLLSPVKEEGPTAPEWLKKKRENKRQRPHL